MNVIPDISRNIFEKYSGVKCKNCALSENPPLHNSDRYIPKVPDRIVKTSVYLILFRLIVCRG